MRASSSVFVLPDAHIPHHSQPSFQAAMEILRDVRPQYGVILGDFADFESLSHHPRNTPEIKKLIAEYDAVNAALDVVHVASPKTKWWFVEGNHEYRAQKFINNVAPQLDGAIIVPQAFNLKERGIEWLPFRSCLRRCWVSPWGVGYMHSAKANGGGGGQHHAAYHALNVAPLSRVQTVVYGHHHSFQMHRTRFGSEAFCGGFLGNFDKEDPAFDYNAGPTDWLNGLLVQRVAKGIVTTIQVPIVDGVAVWG